MQKVKKETAKQEVGKRRNEGQGKGKRGEKTDTKIRINGGKTMSHQGKKKSKRRPGHVKRKAHKSNAREKI